MKPTSQDEKLIPKLNIIPISHVAIVNTDCCGTLHHFRSPGHYESRCQTALPNAWVMSFRSFTSKYTHLSRLKRCFLYKTGKHFQCLLRFICKYAFQHFGGLEYFASVFNLIWLIQYKSYRKYIKQKSRLFYWYIEKNAINLGSLFFTVHCHDCMLSCSFSCSSHLKCWAPLCYT